MYRTENWSDHWKAFSLVAIFCLLWAMMEELGRYVSVSVYQVVWTRYAVHLAVLALIMGPAGFRRLVTTKRPAMQVTCSLLMLGMPLGFIFALRTVSENSVLNIFWLSPLLTLLVCRIEGTRVGWKLWLAAVSLWTGVLFTGGQTLPATRSGLGGALLMSICFALYLIGMRKLANETVPSRLFYTAIFAFAAVSPAIRRLYVPPDAISLVAMTGIGLLGLAALFALDRALELAPPYIVAPSTAMQPIFALVLARLRGAGPHGGGLLVGLVFQLAAVTAVILSRDESSIYGGGL